MLFSDFERAPPRKKGGSMYEIFASIGKYKQEKDQEKDQERNWQVVHSTTIFAFFLFIFFSFFLLLSFFGNGLIYGA